ncbi:MAG: radical SAM protein [bacterium]|nr:radical SAM protein [bacterium]
MREYKDLLDKKYPLFLYKVHFNLTNACNLRCIHCLMVGQSSKDELTTKEVKNILDQLADLGCFELTFSGGEPLLRDDFVDILEYSFKKGFYVFLLTNGTLLTNQIVDRFNSYPIEVQVSLEGSRAEIHDKIVGVNGAFKRIMEGIDMLNKKGIKWWAAQSIIKENFDDIDDFQCLAEKLGIRVYAIPLILPALNRDLSPTYHRLSDDELQALFAKVPLPPYLKDDTLPMGKEARLNFKSRVRLATRHYCVIDSHGKVYPSLYHFWTPEAGDLRKQALSDIWLNSNIFHWMRNLEISAFKCYSCKFLLNKCFPSRGVAYLESGNIFEVPRECCRITKNLIKSQRKLKKGGKR